MKKIFLLLLIFIFLISGILAYPILQPLVLSPLDSEGNIQPNTNFLYTFNISLDSACTDIVSSQSFSVVTDKYGSAVIYLNLSNLDNSFAPYVCEYKGINPVLRTIHNISSQYFNKVYINDLRVYGLANFSTIIYYNNGTPINIWNKTASIQNLINNTNIGFLNVNATSMNLTGDINLGSNNLTNIMALKFNIIGCSDDPNLTEGELCWDSNKNVLKMYTGLGNVVQISQELFKTVKNKAGKKIYNGQIVTMLNSSSGDINEVTLADASYAGGGIDHNLAMVTVPSCNNNAECIVTTYGEVNDLNTLSYGNGTELYLSSDGSGNVTNVKQTFPNYNWHIGDVIRSASASGIIIFNPEIDMNDGVTIHQLGILTNLTVLGNGNFTGNITTNDTGFFSNLGSLLNFITNSWITNIWASNINSTNGVFNNLNVSNNIILQGGGTAPSVPPSGNLTIYGFDTQGHERLTYMDNDGIPITLGRDNFIIAKNTASYSLNKSQMVYVSGSTGNVPNIDLSQSNNISKLPAVGMVMGNISANGFGYVMLLGIITNIDTSSFSTGDRIYVSPTIPGAITNIQPSYPNYVQRVGTVLVSGVGNGAIEVTIAPYVNGQSSGTDNNFTVKGVLTVLDTLNATKYSSEGKLGVNASGTSCTITQITNGIITGATCV